MDRMQPALFALLWLTCSPGGLDQMTHDHAMMDQHTGSWNLAWDARAFIGWNYQYRRFRDFQRVESQNWILGQAQRATATGEFIATGMLSMEPFTIQPLGSPEVFQTGETYQQAPLIDYQHPHDLFMGLGVAYQRTVGTWRTFAEVDAVGAPALGPQAFMHRPSAETNPTAPLGHHMLDSTHNTPGVVTLAVQRGSAAVAGSWFRGMEPDENRKDIDFGALDSWSLQGRWHRGLWDAQVSGAHLTTPEYVEPFSDVTRLTASIAYTDPTGRLAVTVAWGQNQEIHGNLDGYLLEGVFRQRAGHAWYGRAELVTKDILGAGARHPPGFTHFHPLSRVGALTAGYLWDLSASRAGLFSIGADATAYHVAENLRDNYGSPASFHVFMRYEPSRIQGQPPAHHH